MLTLGKHTDPGTINHRLKPHLSEIFDCPADHPFKSKDITNIDHRFFRQVFSGVDKSNPVSFRVNVRHLLNGVLRKRSQMPGCAQLIFTDIFSELIEIPDIRKIALRNQINCEGFRRIQLLPNPICRKHITVVAGIPVHRVSDRTFFRHLFSFKLIINLD